MYRLDHVTIHAEFLSRQLFKYQKFKQIKDLSPADIQTKILNLFIHFFQMFDI